MQLPVDQELRAICQGVLAEGTTLAEWREIESDDMFQSERYEGGFEATEDAFCFSVYLDDGAELWFQFSLDEAALIANGMLLTVEARKANT